MNLDELRQTLMTDPASCRDAADAARAEGGEARRVVDEAAAFEQSLDRALRVDVPAELEQRLLQTPFRAGRVDRRTPGAARWMAIAASLTLAVAITVFSFRDGTDGPHDLGQHLAWHWQHDGPMVLATALEAPSPTLQVQALLSEFGVSMETSLLDDVRLGKICPTPDGAGVHLILRTEDGPVTVYYMPETRVPGSGEMHELADGMTAWVFNVDRGSLALVGEADRDLPQLGQRIAAQLEFPDDLTL